MTSDAREALVSKCILVCTTVWRRTLAIYRFQAFGRFSSRFRSSAPTPPPSVCRFVVQYLQRYVGVLNVLPRKIIRLSLHPEIPV